MKELELIDKVARRLWGVVAWNARINPTMDGVPITYDEGDIAHRTLCRTLAGIAIAECQANNVDFPILNIIDDYLKNGASIEVRDDRVCLVRADGEVLGRGDTLQKLLTELIFILC